MFKRLFPHIVIVLLFFILVFVLNKIPEWYLISGWDFYPLINIEQNLFHQLFTWFNNSGQWQFNPLPISYPFYYFQKILFDIWFSYSQIENSIIFFFILGTFYSFYLWQKVLFWNLKYQFIWPFIYSLNLTTFTIFFYPWVISHHFLLYIFIPLLLSLFIKFILSSWKINKYFIYFWIVFTISLPAYNNLAFLFALFFVEWLFFIIYWLFNISKLNTIKYLIKGITILSLQIIISLIVILPFLSSQYWYKNTIINTKSFGTDQITGFLSSTSSNPLNSFRLIIDNWRYPNIGLETKFSSISSTYIELSSIFSLILIGFITFSLIIKKENMPIRQSKNIFMVLFILYLILLLLSFRLTYPFNSINLFFYKTLTFWLFRSPDKIFIFIPFIFSILFIYSIHKIRMQTKYLYAIYAIYILSIAFIANWWIIKALSITPPNTNYTQLIKIPQEYQNIQKIINKDSSDTFILSLPYSVVNSLNWSNYPKWWYIWSDILHLLYNKNYIQANTYDHPVLETHLSLKDFSNPYLNKKKLLKIIQRFWGKYIINHKDVEAKFVWNAQINLNKLLSSWIINKVTDNDFFTLYEVSKKFITPIIHWLDLNFSRVNPTNYKINIKNIHWKKKITFNQSHNPQWKLFLQTNKNSTWCKMMQKYITWENINECEHKEVFYEWWELSYLFKKPLFDTSHELVNNYANSWIISKQEIIDYVNLHYSDELIKESYPKQLESWKTDYKYYTLNTDWSIDIELTLFFKPQSYFYLGLLISWITFLFLLWWLLIIYKQKKYQK